MSRVRAYLSECLLWAVRKTKLEIPIRFGIRARGTRGMITSILFLEERQMHTHYRTLRGLSIISLIALGTLVSCATEPPLDAGDAAIPAEMLEPAPPDLPDSESDGVTERGSDWKIQSGRLMQVSVGSAKQIWGVNSARRIYQRSSRGWSGRPGSLKQVSVGADGVVWGVNSLDKVFRWTGRSWQYYSQRKLKQISVGSARHIWGVDASNRVYRWSGRSWQTLPGSLSHVSVGSDGTAWGVNSLGKVFRWTGRSWEYYAQRKLKQISVGSARQVRGVDASGRVYRWTGSDWQILSGNLKNVSVSADGTVWGVNSRDSIYSYIGSDTRVTQAPRMTSTTTSTTVRNRVTQTNPGPTPSGAVRQAAKPISGSTGKVAVVSGAPVISSVVPTDMGYEIHGTDFLPADSITIRMKRSLLHDWNRVGDRDEEILSHTDTKIIVSDDSIHGGSASQMKVGHRITKVTPVRTFESNTFSLHHPRRTNLLAVSLRENGYKLRGNWIGLDKTKLRVFENDQLVPQSKLQGPFQTAPNQYELYVDNHLVGEIIHRIEFVDGLPSHPLTHHHPETPVITEVIRSEGAPWGVTIKGTGFSGDPVKVRRGGSHQWAVDLHSSVVHVVNSNEIWLDVGTSNPLMPCVLEVKNYGTQKSESGARYSNKVDYLGAPVTNQSAAQGCHAPKLLAVEPTSTGYRLIGENFGTDKSLITVRLGYVYSGHPPTETVPASEIESVTDTEIVVTGGRPTGGYRWHTVIGWSNMASTKTLDWPNY